MAMTSEIQLTPDLLIVESRHSVRRMLRELIEQSLPGRTILEAADGRSALALATQYCPRVVVMSIHLRDANRMQLVRQFCDELSGSAVIVLTEIQSILNTAKIRLSGALACVHTSEIDTKLVPLAAHVLNRPRQSTDDGSAK